ncbi:hypothetical protein R3P38DRAFT_3229065 [Favolaschia claudopus]|uniref:Ubiquitin-like protease family profile domain-containing protein n=1 Tax=Favolaschia claudopus TaxID=2862362 RepID=A0AAV9ZNT8_9AGAR
MKRLEDGWNGFETDEEFEESDTEMKPSLHKADKSKAGSHVSAGRPPNAKPLHPGRSSTSPTKFSSKPGPKGKTKNSLLPPLDPISKAQFLEMHSASMADLDEPSKSKKNQPPAMGKSIFQKKSAFLNELGFTAEELDVLDIEFNRWDRDYLLRHDEADEMAEVLEALSLTINPAVLVLGPRFLVEAKLLESIDWLPTDEEPIDHSGSPAFSEESVLKRAWLHSQQTTLKEMLVFQYDHSRAHWVLFPQRNIRNIALLGRFFKPGRPAAQVKMADLDVRYRVYNANVQEDGSSCGFWMATTALLMICGASIKHKDTRRMLQSLGIDYLQQHWRFLLTSWRIEEEGLGAEVVNNFLHYWNLDFAQRSGCLRIMFDEWEEENLSLVFRNESLGPVDLRRFIEGWANDEAINMLVAVLNYFPEMAVSQTPLHFGSLFGLPARQPSCVSLTTFFYSKLKELLAAENPALGSSQQTQQTEAELLRWFKKHDLSVLRKFLIPVNEPRNVHWFLIEVDFELKTLSVYDSWPSSNNRSSTLEEKYQVPMAIAVLASRVISKASEGKLLPVSPEWNVSRALCPSQNNDQDCGFFTIMTILHLIHWGRLHPANCPPNLMFSAATMPKIRITLVSKLIPWVESWTDQLPLSQGSGSLCKGRVMKFMMLLAMKILTLCPGIHDESPGKC